MRPLFLEVFIKQISRQKFSFLSLFSALYTLIVRSDDVAAELNILYDIVVTKPHATRIHSCHRTTTLCFSNVCKIIELS